jgi:hypothetical protein
MRRKVWAIAILYTHSVLRYWPIAILYTHSVLRYWPIPFQSFPLCYAIGLLLSYTPTLRRKVWAGASVWIQANLVELFLLDY